MNQYDVSSQRYYWKPQWTYTVHEPMRSHEYTGYQINMCVRGFHSAPIVIDKLMVVGSRCGPIDVALDLLEKKLY